MKYSFLWYSTFKLKSSQIWRKNVFKFVKFSGTKLSWGGEQVLVQKWGQVSDGGIDKIFVGWGTASPPWKKPSPQLSLCTKYALNNTTESLLESPTSWSKVRIYVMPSSKMRLKSVKFNFHFSDLLYTSFAKLLFYNRSHWNWLTTSKNTGSCVKGCKNNTKQRNYLLHFAIS